VKLGYLRQWAIYGASVCSVIPSASSSTDTGCNGQSGESRNKANLLVECVGRQNRPTVSIV